MMAPPRNVSPIKGENFCLCFPFQHQALKNDWQKNGNTGLEGDWKMREEQQVQTTLPNPLVRSLRVSLEDTRGGSKKWPSGKSIPNGWSENQPRRAMCNINADKKPKRKDPREQQKPPSSHLTTHRNGTWYLKCWNVPREKQKDLTCKERLLSS